MKKCDRDDELKKFVCAMHEYEMERLQEQKTAEDSEPLSDTFYQKMKRLTGRVARQERRKKRTRYAAAAAVVLLCLGVTNQDVAARMIEGICGWHDDHVDIQFKEDTGLSTIPEYTLTYVPEGLELVDEWRSEFGTMGSQDYENDETVLWFGYSLSDAAAAVNNEGVKIYVKDYQGIEFYCFEAVEEDEYSQIMWLSEDENVLFWLIGDYSMDVLFHVYEGVQLKTE